MTPRPAAETIAILRYLLRTMEDDPVIARQSIVELKRLILLRIAALESDTTPGAQDATNSTTSRKAA